MSEITIAPPASGEVTALMQGLFGLSVVEAPVCNSEPYSIAEYVDESGIVAGYLACDLASGCRLAAALTQIPAGRVDEALKERALPDNMAENLYEIFNICVNLVVPQSGIRIVLGQVAHGPTSQHYSELSESFRSRAVHYSSFTIARYGSAVLAFGV